MKLNNISDIFRMYGVLGTIRLFLDWLQTKILFRRVRIIRRPYYIRGKKNIDFGNNLTVGVGLRIDVFLKDDTTGLIIGDNVQLNDYVHIGVSEKVTIGNNVLVASKVMIIDHNHGSYNSIKSSNPESKPAERELVSKPVIIEDNVWIGELTSILPGVTIGKGSVIGASSVVINNIPPYSIAVGNPAKVIKKYNFKTNTWENVQA